MASQEPKTDGQPKRLLLNNKEFRVRAFELGDINQLLGLDAKACREVDNWYTRSREKLRETHDLDPELLLVAERGGEIIAYILASIFVMKPYLKQWKKYVEIDSLYVLPGHRNKRIGTRLMKEFIKRWKNKGFSVGVLGKIDDRLVKFYKGIGFSNMEYLFYED